MSASAVFSLQHRAETLPAQLQKRVQARVKRGRGKAVTWPPEDQICQIRFFLCNDVPSSIRSAKNVLQMNHMRTSSTQSNIPSVANTPPVFRGSLVKRARVIECESNMTIERQWDCPKKFVCNSEWLVANGDETEEAGLQQQRELRVLEAFYPRLTAIPDSPAEPVETCTVLHDCLIPAIPLVPIEEEGDESSKESELGAMIVEESLNPDELAGHGKHMEDHMPDFPGSRESWTSSQEPSQYAHDSSIGSADAKVAAAAAAAACMALHKHGATDLVDPDLLAEILRNPLLLKGLTFFNQSSKGPAVGINGSKPSTASQSSQNHNQVLQYDGPPNKACIGASLNAGFPSPVSVLSDWTQQEHAALLPTTHLNSSQTVNAHNCPSSPKRFHNSGSTMESAQLHGFHVRPHEGIMGNDASCIPNVNVQKTFVVHPERSAGMVAPLSQNVLNFHPNVPGWTQPAQGRPSHVGAVHHKGMMSLDNLPCKTSLPEARFKGSENSGSCFVNKAGPRATRMCMYFNTPRGCRNGGNCVFLHQSGGQDLNAITQ